MRLSFISCPLCKLTLLVIVVYTGMPSFQASGQKPARIELLQADRLEYDAALNKDVNKFVGNVAFRHDSAILYCDTALFNELNNSLEAFGKVHIKVNDTLNLYSRQLTYTGNDRLAATRKNIRLVDGKTVLTTDYLDYDRNKGLAYYLGGGTITSGQNRLRSRKGYYYENNKEFFYKDSVYLVNKRYTMTSDTLRYNTISEIAYFFGPTRITSKENVIVCENGWYDTRKDESEFRKNARIYSKSRILTGDSLYYNRKLGFGKAIGNIFLQDTVKRTDIMGDYAYYDEFNGYAMVTGHAQAILINGADSLFLHGDTLRARVDSQGETDRILAYYGVRYYRDDLQGIADSLAYNVPDSIISFYDGPVMWSDENQLTADTIHILLEGGELHSLQMDGSAMIISQEGKETYNQIKGRAMAGIFRNNELAEIRVNGNSETIYYVRDEQNALSGVNVSVSGNMSIRLEDRKISEITYIRKPVATFHPPGSLPADQQRLAGFKWKAELRPASRADIFRQQ